MVQHKIGCQKHLAKAKWSITKMGGGQINGIVMEMGERRHFIAGNVALSGVLLDRALH